MYFEHNNINTNHIKSIIDLIDLEKTITISKLRQNIFIDKNQVLK